WKKVSGKRWAFAAPVEADPYWEFSRKIGDFDPLRYWRKVKAPTFLVYGELDQRVPARRSAARIAETYLSGVGTQMRAEFFKGADHSFRLPPERTDRFAWPKSATGYPAAVVDWACCVTRVGEPN